ncbi:MAG: hypothetical protein WCK41_00240 [Actinomycetes bacterium]
MTAWLDITRRNARSVQTTVGWIFWDPGAIERYAATETRLPEGFAGPLGYMAARCAPLAGAGPDAVIAAFGSISPSTIRALFDLLDGPEQFMELSRARNNAVDAGLRGFAPDIVEPLIDFGPELWAAIEQLPLVGRVFYAAHLTQPRPRDPLLSGWHAVNCIREWRGDTHWALVVGNGLTHAEASILHNAWLGYERDWLARSRGTTPEDVEAGWIALENRGLVDGGNVNARGIALRQLIEDETDRLTTTPWELIGEQRSVEFANLFEPPCEILLERVNQTAGPNYQPASRLRPATRVTVGKEQ